LRRAPHLARPVLISIGPSPVLPDDDSIEGEPRIHGSGAVDCIAIEDCFAGLLLNDRSLWRLRPNPIDSNTSCRATRVDYDRSTVIEASGSPTTPRNEFEEVAPGYPLSQALPRRAASRTPSRKGDAFRRTRGAFHPRTSPCGECPLSTVCSQPVEMVGARLFYLRALPPHGRCVGGDVDSASLRRVIATLRRGPNTRAR